MKKTVLVCLSIIISSIIIVTGIVYSSTTTSKTINKSDYKRARINQGTAAPWDVPIKSWDYYGEQIQIETDTGLKILIDKSNVILVNK
jgi:archaellum component FlaF (FlaF/FlaG flagellin family)